MFTLGINAVYHDSAASILKNGKLLAAAEEERFTHIKHGKRPVPFSTYELPFHAINYCPEVAGIHLGDVDHFAYSFDPYLLLGSCQKNFFSYFEMVVTSSVIPFLSVYWTIYGSVKYRVWFF